MSNEIISKSKEEELESFYFQKIKSKASVGLDKINVRLFEENKSQYFRNISKKIKEKKYKFTPYKQKLISKGKYKLPRVISIPTIRDKIVLGILKELVCTYFGYEIKFDLAQTIISELNKEIKSEKYDSFFKIDISNFYDSIDHDLLISRLKDNINCEFTLALLISAIKTVTVDENDLKKNRKSVNDKGVPQGLSISNVLASIYLSKFDDEFARNENIKYFRYVDDILILSNDTYLNSIKNEISTKIKDNYKLEINEDKTYNGEISKGFEYLGYRIQGTVIKVKESSVHKLEKSLENLFNDFQNLKNKNIEIFIWKLNLRISGAKYENKKYGWLMFFSQINDLNVLFKLDWLVKKLIRRFKLEEKVEIAKIKKFTRAYNEIRKNFRDTKYIPDFTKFSIEKKIELLIIFNGENKVFSMKEEDINSEFNKIIYTSVKDLDKDIQNIS